MKKAIQFISRCLEIAVVIMLTAMSCLVFINVVLRYGFNSSINVTEEISRYLFVWLTFLGAILAFSENRHINVTTLIDRLSPLQRNILNIITNSLMIFCCMLILGGSWTQFLLNKTNLAPISGIPTGVIYLASTLTSIAISLMLIMRIASTIGLIVNREKHK